MIVLVLLLAAAAGAHAGGYHHHWNAKAPVCPVYTSPKVGLECAAQGNPANACWKCKGYRSYDQTFYLDITACGFEGLCCTDPMCTVKPINAVPTGRKLHQLVNLVAVTATPGFSSARLTCRKKDLVFQRSGRLGRRLMGDGDDWWKRAKKPAPCPPTWPTPVWRYCPKVGPGCCVAGDPGPCAMGNVCVFTVNFANTAVCTRLPPPTTTIPTPTPAPTPTFNFTRRRRGGRNL